MYVVNKKKPVIFITYSLFIGIYIFWVETYFDIFSKLQDDAVAEAEIIHN
jgi:hypothetical protein